MRIIYGDFQVFGNTFDAYSGCASLIELGLLYLKTNEERVYCNAIKNSSKVLCEKVRAGSLNLSRRFFILAYAGFDVLPKLETVASETDIFVLDNRARGHQCLDAGRDAQRLLGDSVKIRSTEWFPLTDYAPVRDGWYEVQLASGATAFAKFGDNEWTEKPLLVFTHWRGLAADPSAAEETENIGAEVVAAEGVRAVWDKFFPGSGEERHKPLEAQGKE